MIQVDLNSPKPFRCTLAHPTHGSRCSKTGMRYSVSAFRWTHNTDSKGQRSETVPPDSNRADILSGSSSNRSRSSNRSLSSARPGIKLFQRAICGLNNSIQHSYFYLNHIAAISTRFRCYNRCFTTILSSYLEGPQIALYHLCPQSFATCFLQTMMEDSAMPTNQIKYLFRGTKMSPN